MFSNNAILRSDEILFMRQIADFLPEAGLWSILKVLVLRFVTRWNNFLITCLVLLYMLVLMSSKYVKKLVIFQELLVALGLRFLAPEAKITKRQPGFTTFYAEVLTSEQRKHFELHGKLPEKDSDHGLYSDDGIHVVARFLEDETECPNGDDGCELVKHKGDRMRNWEVMSQDMSHHYKVRQDLRYQQVFDMAEMLILSMASIEQDSAEKIQKFFRLACTKKEEGLSEEEEVKEASPSKAVEEPSDEMKEASPSKAVEEPSDEVKEASPSRAVEDPSDEVKEASTSKAVEEPSEDEKEASPSKAVEEKTEEPSEEVKETSPSKAV